MKQRKITESVVVFVSRGDNGTVFSPLQNSPILGDRQIHNGVRDSKFLGGYDFILPEYYGHSRFALLNFAQITWILYFV